MKTNAKLHRGLLAVFLAFALVFAGAALFIKWNIPGVSASPAEKTIRQYARSNGHRFTEYPESLISLLERNPETEEFVLHYPEYKDKTFEINLDSYKGDSVPLFMQWDTRWGYMEYGDGMVAMTGCGPVCLAMAGFFLTQDDAFSPDKIVSYAIREGYCVPGNGSAWTLISEGGVRLGLDVTEIPLDENRIQRNLEAGNPIICVMGPGDFTNSGHYIVMTGLENGLIRINDPNSYANSQKLWNYDDIYDQIRNLWVIRK